MSREIRLLSPRQNAVLRWAAGGSAVVLLAGARLAPERAWSSLLLGAVYCAALALGAAVFVAVQRVASAGWPTLLRRVPEAMTAYLPAGAAVCAVVALGARWIYPWAGASAVDLGDRAGYFRVGWFVARAAVCWGVWIFFTSRLRALSREQDENHRVQLTRRAQLLSAVFLPLFGLTFTVFSIDWVMSVEPRWATTMYPWLLFAGSFEAALAALTVLVLLLHRRGAFPRLNEHHRHDLGKYLFAFSCFWAYLWFCQALLIWYSNIPDETTHYVLRLSPGWAPLFWLNAVVNFMVPFAWILPARRKKREGTLLAVSAVLLAGWALDLYTLIMPPIQGPRPLFGVWEAAGWLLPAALFVLLFDRAFAAAPSEPVGDPYLEESRDFAGV